jgi:hypothetical protein
LVCLSTSILIFASNFFVISFSCKKFRSQWTIYSFMDWTDSKGFHSFVLSFFFVFSSSNEPSWVTHFQFYFIPLAHLSYMNETYNLN